MGTGIYLPPTGGGGGGNVGVAMWFQDIGGPFEGAGQHTITWDPIDDGTGVAVDAEVDSGISILTAGAYHFNVSVQMQNGVGGVATPSLGVRKNDDSVGPEYYLGPTLAIQPLQAEAFQFSFDTDLEEGDVLNFYVNNTPVDGSVNSCILSCRRIGDIA